MVDNSKLDRQALKQYAQYEKAITHKDLRKIFMDKDPHCHWCKVMVVEYPEIQNRSLKRGEQYPPDGATIDHLYDRFDTKNRYKVYKNYENKVLACYKCNQDRAKKRVLSIPKHIRQHRSDLGAQRSANKSTFPRPMLFPTIQVVENE